ncbi:hypothetical protein LTR22_015435 [Elasticomyces elasticus]|nr:hypothetical protein LTR22_015435 [Elasticomyces elasticus]KAK4922035.1 hypothetical protein LTR49_010621 [Elasticomyces elasticus]KAK5768783.1 hypothetical protein LTS12_000842 [Elasticomyces elasticus]
MADAEDHLATSIQHDASWQTTSDVDDSMACHARVASPSKATTSFAVNDDMDPHAPILTTLAPELLLIIAADLPLNAIVRLRHLCRIFRELVDKHESTLAKPFLALQHARLRTQIAGFNLTGLDLATALRQHADCFASYDRLLQPCRTADSFALHYPLSNPTTSFRFEDLTTLAFLLTRPRNGPEWLARDHYFPSIPGEQVAAVWKANQRASFWPANVTFTGMHSDRPPWKVLEMTPTHMQCLDVPSPMYLGRPRDLVYAEHDGELLERLMVCLRPEQDSRNGQSKEGVRDHSLIKARCLQLVHVANPALEG